MHKILLLVLLALGLNASEMTWFTSYEKAQISAKAQNKPMLLFMNKKGCGSCEYMKENVFTDKDIIAYLNQNYIAVALDIYKNDAPKDFQVKVTPVFHFTSSDGTKLRESLIGGKTAPFFIKLLKKANSAQK